MTLESRRESPRREAVLLLAFNRPDTTARVFEQIRSARPPRLYVAVDGPRRSRAAEAALCAEVRRIASAVDWPCELRTRFREENLGCKRRVSDAIDWFFSNEERGIVLEDDCLPSASFFTYCETLLERFRDDARVFAIQGTFFGASPMPESSYLFSKMFHMWGWASWADRWEAVRIEPLDVPGIRRALAEDLWQGRSSWIRDYWLDTVAHQATGEVDSWGYPVMFHCFRERLFNVTPTTNLVLNIGTGESATRTVELDGGPHHRSAQDIRFPLVDGAPYEGADAMLPFEHRWRAQLTPWRLLRQVFHYRFPRLYAALRRAIRGTRA
jgi:hypothetical protein